MDIKAHSKMLLIFSFSSKLWFNFLAISVSATMLNACATGFKGPEKNDPQGTISLQKNFILVPENADSRYANEWIYLQQFFANSGNICDNRKMITTFSNINSKKNLKIKADETFNLYARTDYVTETQGRENAFQSAIKDSYPCYARASFKPKNGFKYSAEMVDKVGGSCELRVIEVSSNLPPSDLEVVYGRFC